MDIEQKLDKPLNEIIAEQKQEIAAANAPANAQADQAPKPRRSNQRRNRYSRRNRNGNQANNAGNQAAPAQNQTMAPPAQAPANPQPRRQRPRQRGNRQQTAAQSNPRVVMPSPNNAPKKLAAPKPSAQPQQARRTQALRAASQNRKQKNLVFNTLTRQEGPYRVNRHTAFILDLQHHTKKMVFDYQYDRNGQIRPNPGKQITNKQQQQQQQQQNKQNRPHNTRNGGYTIGSFSLYCVCWK